MAGLGKRIKMRRELLGMTQEQLAHKMGYRSKSTITKIESETNDIPQSKIRNFADALLCTPEYLLGLDQDDNFTFSKHSSEDVGVALRAYLRSIGFHPFQGFTLSVYSDNFLPNENSEDAAEWYVADMQDGKIYHVTRDTLNNYANNIASFARFQMQEITHSCPSLPEPYHGNPSFRGPEDLNDPFDN